METAVKTNSTLDIKSAKNHIVQWMNDYMEKSGQKIWILGVSGGVDSALASALCAETNYPLFCVRMPIHQNDEHVSRANEQITWLKKNYDDVDSIKLELTPTFDTMVSDFERGASQIPFEVDESTDELALANVRSRLRMIGLYYYSNRLSGLVCGTGNKVEDFGVGFFTVGGDGQVDLSPIADLLKSEVREMARVMGVSENILNAVPSDGLWDDTRSDEDQIGAAYDELEWAMAYLDDEPAGNARAHLSERQIEVLEIFEQRHNANRHKMDSIPVCSVSEFR